MYCVIQFYVQLRITLADYKPLLKVLAIKLVIFLSFWQASAISIGTSTLQIVHPNATIAYPDIKVGVPALLLCVEMALFSILHLWAFPYAPYRPGASTAFYPVPDPTKATSPVENAHQPPSGGFMGFRAILDALNIWDFVKAFGRGIRWIFCGVRRRKEDTSYMVGRGNSLNMGNLPRNKHAPSSYESMRPGSDGMDSEYTNVNQAYYGREQDPATVTGEESARLISHAAPSPNEESDGARRADGYRDGSPYRHPRQQYPSQIPPIPSAHHHYDNEATYPEEPPSHGDYPPSGNNTYGPLPEVEADPPERNDTGRARVGEALWAPR